MAETGAHLVDHVFPPLAVRQWLLAVPNRLPDFLQRDTALHGAALRILLSVWNVAGANDCWECH